MPRTFLLLLVMLPLWLRGQPAPVQPLRLELNLDAYGSDVRVLPLPDTSVALFIENLPSGSFRSQYSFRQLDRRLNQVREVPVEVNPEFELKQACAELPYAYALFQSSFVKARFQLFRLDLRSGHVIGFGFDTKLVTDVYDLEALDGKLFSTAQLERHLTVLHINPDQEEFRLLPAVYETLPAQLSFLADSVTKRAGYVLSQSNGFQARLQIKQLSAQGQLLASQFIQAESGRGLVTAELSPGDTSKRLLAGTYTLRDPRYAQGLFATGLVGGTAARPPLRFYDFSVLKHFFDFMNPRRAARLRARSAERRAAGRDLRLRYRILTHRLLPFQDGYVLVAEVYYPRYRSDTQNSSFLPTRRTFNPYRTTRLWSDARTSDGYRSSHAIVCGFDSNGTLLWDNTFVLKDAERPDLTEIVRVRPLPDGRGLVLVYLEDNRIRYKIVDRTTPSPNDLHVPIQTNLSGAREKTLHTQQQAMLPWYGSRFLAYGYQRVRPERSGASREVFFLNAVDFQ